MLIWQRCLRQSADLPLIDDFVWERFHTACATHPLIVLTLSLERIKIASNTKHSDQSKPIKTQSQQSNPAKLVARGAS